MKVVKCFAKSNSLKKSVSVRVAGGMGEGGGVKVGGEWVCQHAVKSGGSKSYELKTSG